MSCSPRENGCLLNVSIYKRVIAGHINDVPKRIVRIYTSEENQLSIGDVIRFKATLQPLKETADMPWQESEAALLSRKGISATAFIVSPDSVSIYKSHGPVSFFNSLKESCMTSILRSSLSTGAKEFLTAVLLGDRSILSDIEIRNFSQSGLSHTLALSGLHVGLLVILLSYLLWPIRSVGLGRRSHGFILLLLLWGYALLTGMCPTVIRAVIMSSIFILSGILGRHHNSYNALLLAWLTLLIANPYYIFDAGFILSFSAVISVLLFAKSLTFFQKRKWPLRNIGQITGVTVAATIGTGLISSAIFHIFPLTFLISNLIVLPILPFLLGGGMLLVCGLAAGLKMVWLCDILSYLYLLVSNTVNFLSSLPFGIVDNIFIPLWMGLTWIGILIVWRLCCVFPDKRNTIRSYAVILSAGCVCLFAIELMPDRKLPSSIYCLRVGEYSTVLLHNYNELTIMTSAPQRKWPELIDDIRERHREFIHRQRIKSVKVAEPKFLKAGDQSLLLVSDCRKVRQIHSKINYTLLCHSFTGTIRSLTDSIQTETVVFSHRFPRTRREKLAGECDELGIKWISLKDTPLRIGMLTADE